MTTAIHKFQAQAAELFPEQDGLQDVDPDLDTEKWAKNYGSSEYTVIVDHLYSRKGECIGGMAMVIAEICERTDAGVSITPTNH